MIRVERPVVPVESVSVPVSSIVAVVVWSKSSIVHSSLALLRGCLLELLVLVSELFCCRLDVGVRSSLAFKGMESSTGLTLLCDGDLSRVELTLIVPMILSEAQTAGIPAHGVEANPGD